jgi:hypothetical protein
MTNRDRINLHIQITRQAHRLARMEAERTRTTVSQVVERALDGALASLLPLITDSEGGSR